LSWVRETFSPGSSAGSKWKHKRYPLRAESALT
jgi:hypothetical protein